MIDRLSSGRNARPAEKFVDFSSCSFGIPNALVTGLSLFDVSTCVGWSMPIASGRNSDDTFENHSCCSDGARKPVLTAARSDSPPPSLARAAALPITDWPKSE